jgi:hypothetical protein
MAKKINPDRKPMEASIGLVLPFDGRFRSIEEFGGGVQWSNNGPGIRLFHLPTTATSEVAVDVGSGSGYLNLATAVWILAAIRLSDFQDFHTYIPRYLAAW